MKTTNRFLRYFLYAFLVGIIMVVGSKYQLQFEKYTQLTGDPTTGLYFSFLFPVAIGMLIALPGLISNIKKGGTWKFDWVRFVAIGLPALILGITPFLYNWNMVPLFRWSAFYIQIIILNPLPRIIACVTLGFLLLSVFEKTDKFDEAK